MDGTKGTGLGSPYWFKEVRIHIFLKREFATEDIYAPEQLDRIGMIY
jgi:hypothetical protein